MEFKQTNNMIHILDFLGDSEKISPAVSADDILKRDRRFNFIENKDLPSVHFEKMKLAPGDTPLLMLERDLYFCIISEQGAVAKLYYREGKDTLFIQEKDPEQALSFLVRVIGREFEEMKNEIPELAIEQDYERRKKQQNRLVQNKIQSLKSNCDEIPDDFWDAIEHIYDWASNYDEFRKVLSIGDASVFGYRALERLQRATTALEDPNDYNGNQAVIYRGLPSGEVIEEGDWVSYSESYASEHESNSENGITISEVVYEDEIYEGGSPDELIYVPRDTWKGADSLKDVWDMVNVDNKPSSGPNIKRRSFEEIRAEKVMSGLEPN